MMKTITFKRGTSFGAAIRYVLPEGSSVDPSEIVVSSQVRTAAGALVAALTITSDSDGLGFYSEAEGGTAGWPLGALFWDFKLVIGDRVGASDTIALNILREVTK